MENAPAGLSQEEFGEYVAIQIGKAVGQAERQALLSTHSDAVESDPIWRLNFQRRARLLRSNHRR